MKIFKTCHFIISRWMESYDYQSNDSNDDFKIDFTCFSLVWSISETLDILTSQILHIYYYLRSFTTIYWHIMKQNSNDDITMETLENQITLETLDHLIINAIKEIPYDKKKRPDENSIFEYLNKTLENSELSKQYIESRLSSMIVDGKLEKKKY